MTTAALLLSFAGLAFDMQLADSVAAWALYLQLGLFLPEIVFVRWRMPLADPGGNLSPIALGVLGEWLARHTR
ncbi:exported hypothetical protein [Candidatus Sulfopaludibacter sp. SbA3]|nr:exported hypothetical protein [Candidatus Sulfopaludibacter sp. SbA3]